MFLRPPALVVRLLIARDAGLRMPSEKRSCPRVLVPLSRFCLTAHDVRSNRLSQVFLCQWVSGDGASQTTAWSRDDMIGRRVYSGRIKARKGSTAQTRCFPGNVRCHGSHIGRTILFGTATLSERAIAWCTMQPRICTEKALTAGQCWSCRARWPFFLSTGAIDFFFFLLMM